MNVNIYSIFDSAASAFITPFYMHNDGLAIRAFQDNVNAGDDNNIAKHPDQFTLFRLGEYDDKTGKITPEDTPISVALGVELINDDKPRYTNVDMKIILEAIKQIADKGDISPQLKEVK